jgi:hypothetical protein
LPGSEKSHILAADRLQLTTIMNKKNHKRVSFAVYCTPYTMQFLSSAFGTGYR